MKLRRKPIQPKGISDPVFDQLRDLISKGEWRPGEKILAEGEDGRRRRRLPTGLVHGLF
ncbi:MAG: hypothetical protein LJE65_15460 [Desulfobacteraceae bacterium]|nr:hypothetical protein [Desulfobacteraceae bacterium]